MNLGSLVEGLPEEAKEGAIFLRDPNGTSFTKWWGNYEVILGGLTRFIYEIQKDVDEALNEEQRPGQYL